jgi:hypothetical protein
MTLWGISGNYVTFFIEDCKKEILLNFTKKRCVIYKHSHFPINIFYIKINNIIFLIQFINIIFYFLHNFPTVQRVDITFKIRTFATLNFLLLFLFTISRKFL